MKAKAAKAPIKLIKNSGQRKGINLVRIAGLEPAQVTPLPPQSSASANSTICANVHFSLEILTFPRRTDHQKSPVLTPVLTRTQKRRRGRRFQRASNGLYRFKRTGTLYAVFKVEGRTRWKCLSTEDIQQARRQLAEEIKNASAVDWRQAATVTVRQLLNAYQENPIGLTAVFWPRSEPWVENDWLRLMPLSQLSLSS